MLMLLDLEKLRMIYQLGASISLADIQDVIKASKTMNFESSEVLIKQHSSNNRVFLIRKGMVRRYAINSKGEEITTGVFWEHQLVANPDMILFDQPSRFIFEAMEPTKTLSINYDVLQSIISKNPKLEKYRKPIFLNLFKKLSARLDSFILRSPEERYLDFLKSHAQIIHRVPNKYIANILGITPVSLSRIRKRIAERGK